MDLEYRECPVCGLDISNTHRNRRFCSHYCKNRARVGVLLEADCTECGAHFTGIFAGKQQLTCSRECNVARQTRLRREKAAARLPRSENMVCEECGEAFTYVRKAGPVRMYCSTHCRNAASRKSMTPERKKAYALWHTWKLTPEAYEALISRGCEVCGAHDDLKIDHDHNCCPDSNKGTCGKCIRGVLCGRCNAAEGMLLGDPDRAMQLAFYMLKNTNVLEGLNA